MVDFEQLEPPQRRAALAYDRNYAVTAGAGSGKTTTFAMRYLQLLEQTTATPESIAAITFTESGAMELQERVRESVSDRLLMTNGETYAKWREYHDALPEAYIHTIHGFCARLLREYALHADVPVGFDVIEETAAKGQQLDTVERFIEQHIDDDRVELLTEIYYQDRLEDVLCDLLSEHHQARRWADTWANATPEEYFTFVRQQFCDIDIDAARRSLESDSVQSAIQSIYDVSLVESAGSERIGIAENVAAVVDTYGSSPDGKDDAVVHDLMAALCEALTSGGSAYRGGFDTWSYTGHDDWSAESSQRFDDATTTLAERLPIEQWASADRLGVDRNAAQYYVALASLYRELHDMYQARKRRENALDFADLIDEAIRLLDSNPAIQTELRGSFDYLMLDEVQDTDPRQWELVQLLTSVEETYDKCNVFVVGDEKQSIFRFRGADVAQFRRERERLETVNASKELCSLDERQPVNGDDRLSRNFRSLPPVLEPINDLFDRLFGDIPDTYQDTPAGIPDDETRFEPDPQRLTPARTDEEDLSTGATFVVVPEEQAVREAVLEEGHALRDGPSDATELDTQALAAEVATLLDGDARRYETTGFEDGELVEEPTSLEPSDIAVLLRKRTHLKHYERALAKRNIPYTVASGIGFYESTEITALRNLFHVLSDPSDDLALYSVLRSPLFGFADSRIASLWTEIDTRRVGEGELWEVLEITDDDQLVAVREQLEEWRRLTGIRGPEAVIETWDTLLGRIIEDTGFLMSLATDERGQQAVANVEKFRARLRTWSEDGVQTLPGVVDRIEREIELSSREGEAEVPDDADGVRIMTVHDAKGREFPAVFVPGLSHNFNLKPGYGEGIAEFETVPDESEEMQSPLLGIKGPGIDDAFEQTDTILKDRLKFARKREAIAEEKRILYVAMTRARDHLYLVGTASTDDDGEDIIDTGDGDNPSNWYDFLAPLVLDEAARDSLATTGEYNWRGTANHPLTVRLPNTGSQLPTEDSRDSPSLSFDVDSLTQDREYSIAASYLGSLIQDDAPGRIRIDHSGTYVSYVPSDGQDGESSSGESTRGYLPRNVFGSTLHKAVELDVEPTNESALRRLATQFAVQEDVSVDRVDDNDLAELQRHLRVAQTFIDGLEADVIAEERPVRVALEHGETYGDIDFLAVTNDAYHIVDYKTNKITAQEALTNKAQHYKWQLVAYAVALHQSDPHRNVTATLLFTEAGESRDFSWTGSELDELTTTLDRKICTALKDSL